MLRPSSFFRHSSFDIRHRFGHHVSSGKPTADEVTRLADLSPQQWESGIAAWLGWLFDGLDMHLYTLVAAPFVAELLGVDDRRSAVGRYSSGSRRRSSSAGRWAADSSAASAIGWAAAGR